MAVKQAQYVGERIRAEIKRKRLTNGYVLLMLKDRNMGMSEPTFSNKLYGVRQSFTDQEVKEISEILNVDFTSKG